MLSLYCCENKHGRKYAYSNNMFSVWRETFVCFVFVFVWHNGAQQGAVTHRIGQLPEVDTEEKKKKRKLTGSVDHSLEDSW